MAVSQQRNGRPRTGGELQLLDCARRHLGCTPSGLAAAAPWYLSCWHIDDDDDDASCHRSDCKRVYAFRAHRQRADRVRPFFSLGVACGASGQLRRFDIRALAPHMCPFSAGAAREGGAPGSSSTRFYFMSAHGEQTCSQRALQNWPGHYIGNRSGPFYIGIKSGPLNICTLGDFAENVVHVKESLE